jgi:predicted RNA-binding protein Jag
MTQIPVTDQNIAKALATADAILDAMTTLAKAIDKNGGNASTSGQQSATAIAQLGQALDAVQHVLHAYNEFPGRRTQS